LLTCCKNFQEEDNAEAAGRDDDEDDDMPDLESLNYDDLDSVSKLQKTQRYNDIMQVCNATQPQFLEHA
jgi:U4/U6 small nuclear ribonucleoprotein PRP31